MYSGRQPSDYSENFNKLKKFIDQSLDENKHELVRVLFPVFVCLYLNMILKKFYAEAKTFLSENKGEFHGTHRQEIAILETVNDTHRLEDPEVSKYLKNKFFVKMSRPSYTLLKFQVDFEQLTLITHILNLNIFFQISSEADLVLDSRVHESILLTDGDTTDAHAQEEDEDGNLLGNGLTGELQALTLGRLKEFYLDSADIVGSGAGNLAVGGAQAIGPKDPVTGAPSGSAPGGATSQINTGQSSGQDATAMRAAEE